MFNKLVTDVISNVYNGKDFLYPVSENDLGGLAILISNCTFGGKELLHNMQFASIDPSIWLGDFLDKYWNKMSYVTAAPNFNLLIVESGKIVIKPHGILSENFETDEDINTFFNNPKNKKLAIYTITKWADLALMKTWYSLRYANLTEKSEIRGNYIDTILEV